MQSIRIRKKRFLIFALAVTVVLAAATCFVAVNAVRQMNKIGEVNSEMRSSNREITKCFVMNSAWNYDRISAARIS